MSKDEYDQWYQERKRELADLLIDALLIACDINEYDDIWGCIERKVKSLGLPKQKCKRCGAELEYWDYKMGAGYCQKCVRDLMKEAYFNEH